MKAKIDDVLVVVRESGDVIIYCDEDNVFRTKLRDWRKMNTEVERKAAVYNA